MTRKITTSAIMIAVATVLSMFAVYKLSNGGSVTIGSMVPILIIAFMYDTKFAILTSLAYSLIQMVLGFYPPPTQTFTSFVLVILLDYVIAFGVIGTAGIFYKLFKEKTWAIPVSGAIVLSVRFICHFLSGILIWQSYALEGQNPYVYSLVYNGSYMLAEIIITTIVLTLLSKFIKGRLIKQ